MSVFFRHFRRGLCACIFIVFSGLLLLQACLPASAQESLQAEKCRPSNERTEQLKAARQGMFRFLNVTENPLYLGDLQFQDEQDNSKSLADFSGKTLLVNLWGVWCPPCRAEIPDLAELQNLLQGTDFTVLTLYDNASSKDRVRAFLAEKQAENLPLYHDQNMKIYGALKREGLARGLPLSLLVDTRGCLIASLSGGAAWSSGDALAFIKAAQQTQ